MPGTDTPTASDLSLSEYMPGSPVDSLVDYKWKVVAKNLNGPKTGPAWTFMTMDRRDISTTLTPGPQGPSQGMLIDATVGIGNTGRLVGSPRPTGTAVASGGPEPQ